jgi:hypothetical protein
MVASPASTDVSAGTYVVDSTSHEMRHHNGQVVSGHTQLEGVRARMQHHGFLSPLAHIRHRHDTRDTLTHHNTRRGGAEKRGGVGASSTGGSSKDGDL